jgi:hypothetical protein
MAGVYEYGHKKTLMCIKMKPCPATAPGCGEHRRFVADQQFSLAARRAAPLAVMCRFDFTQNTA